MSDEAITAAPEPEEKRGFTLPSAYTILFMLIVIAAIATWVIPAGTYKLNDAGEPVPGTYHEVTAKHSKIVVDSLTAPINGLYGIEDSKGNINYYNSGTLFGAIDIALFILVIGGFLGVTMKSGAIQAGIGSLVQRMKGRERWMIPVLMCVFALGGTTFGMAEESLAFYALVIPVMIAAGYDALTGAAVLLLGCGIGVMGSTVNPFATGIASGIAGVPISEGLIGRLVILIVGLAIGIFFVMRYADRVKRDPTKSVVFTMKADNEARFRADSQAGGAVLTGTHKVVLAVFALAFVVMIYGVIPWEDLGIGLPTWWWWFPEMTASFLLFSIIIGLVAGMREGELTDSFVDGARDLLGVALIIGIARGITVIMNNGKITDTVLHWIEKALGGTGARRVPDHDVPAVPAAVVPDPLDLGPGDAGHADHGAAGGLRRRLGSAGRDRLPERLRVMNIVVPTSAVVMGGLAIARVPYGTYLRWVWPLLCCSAGCPSSCSRSGRPCA